MSILSSNICNFALKNAGKWWVCGSCARLIKMANARQFTKAMNAGPSHPKPNLYGKMGWWVCVEVAAVSENGKCAPLPAASVRCRRFVKHGPEFLCTVPSQFWRVLHSFLRHFFACFWPGRSSFSFLFSFIYLFISSSASASASVHRFTIRGDERREKKKHKIE